MTATFIALILIAHGLVHTSLAFVPSTLPDGKRAPFWPAWWRKETDPAWFTSKLGLSNAAVSALGWQLWLASVVLFTLAGLGLLGVPGLAVAWQILTGAGAVISLTLLVFYWHPWLFLGAVIDLLALAMVLLRYPAVLFPS